MKLNELENLLTQTVEHLGYVLWGLEYLPYGKNALLRIFIDKSSGIQIKDCEIVSQQVNALLDVEDILQGSYNLEVSSPGIPRPLFKKWQYEEYMGSAVSLKIAKAIDGKRKFKGLINSVDDMYIQLDVSGVLIDIPFQNIIKANVIDERGRDE